MSASPTADTGALMTLAATWDQRADSMEQECKDKPCSHSHGYRLAAYELRQALAQNDSLRADD
jgi:hypothetical protein